MGKKKPAVEAGLNPILLRRVGGDRCSMLRYSITVQFLFSIFDISNKDISSATGSPAAIRSDF
jgi:hypothetical protein